MGYVTGDGDCDGVANRNNIYYFIQFICIFLIFSAQSVVNVLLQDPNSNKHE